MTQQPDLNALRNKIDALDDKVHDLLMERFAITAEVAKAKGAASDPTLIPRPAREEAVLSRLSARHSGDLPGKSLVRIWKEIMGAACHQQGDFRVGVAADPFGALALAVRDHFGTAVRLKFSTLDELGAEIQSKRLALVVASLEADVPDRLYEIGFVEADGARVGRLLSTRART